jgi:hypothetical protein
MILIRRRDAATLIELLVVTPSLPFGRNVIAGLGNAKQKATAFPA